MCESFSCTPSEAERELDRDAETVFDIIQLRAYAETKRALDNAKTKEEVDRIPQTPILDMVTDIMLELHQTNE